MAIRPQGKSAKLAVGMAGWNEEILALEKDRHRAGVEDGRRNTKVFNLALFCK